MMLFVTELYTSGYPLHELFQGVFSLYPKDHNQAGKVVKHLRIEYHPPFMDILHTLAMAPSLPLLLGLSFLASTLLPVGSEWLLVIMIMQGFSPVETVTVATIGNYLGGCTNYFIGVWGADFVVHRILRIDDDSLARARAIFSRYGTWSLLLSWLPVVGDPLCLLAGILRIGIFRFSLFVFVGKFCRYATLAILTLYGTAN